MVWLNAADENGNGLYLNIHRIEQREGAAFALHGTMGDGFYEGEVLVEVAVGVKVTFADEWLDRRTLEEFFLRVPRSEVEGAVAEKAAGMFFCVDNFPSIENRPRREVVSFRSEGRSYPVRPLREEQMELPMVGEGEAGWRAA